MRDIPGFGGKYSVSEDAVVLCGEKVVAVVNRGKYPGVNLNRRMYYLHRVVAICWVPNPLSLPEVNHIDGNKFNCVATNLEWVTHRQNIRHAFAIGLRKSGQCKFSKREILAMVVLLERGISYREVGEIFKCDKSTVRRLCDGYLASPAL